MKVWRMFRTAVLAISLSATLPVLAADNVKDLPEDGEFVRFVEDGTGAARLQTAVVKYRNAAGIRVTLVGAVHVADSSYFDDLNKLFTHYDAVLYEMVGGPIEKREERMKELEMPATTPPANGLPGTDGESTDDLLSTAASGQALSWLPKLHEMLQSTLSLEGQVEGIDYHQPNFVHADMSLEEFSSMQEERQEGFLALWLKALQVQMENPQKPMNQPGLLQILEILTREDSPTELKRLIGRSFDSVEALMAGMEAGNGTVIVTERNKVALKVLEAQMKLGKKNLAIFYGSAHLPDMEKRLKEMGFQKEDAMWMTAWDLPPPAPVKEKVK